MDLYLVALILATFLVSLVAGFLVAFALIAMPGIGQLGDREFVRAFQTMDGIIQRGHPMFLLLWVGSVVTLAGATFLAFPNLDGTARWLLGLAAALYILGVQLPTAGVNVPLNNRIQTVDAAQADDATLRQAREDFEARWNRWNVRRTVVACTASALLVVLLARL